MTVGRSFDVVVNWNYKQGDEGIVFAHGGQHMGYVVFVKDGMLNFHSNANGTITKLAPIKLGESSSTFTLHVTAPGKRQWEVGFTINGVAHPRQGGFTQPFSFLPYEGIDVGMDRRSPVSWEIYQQHGCYPYTGGIASVTYLPGEFAPDEGPGALQTAIELGLALE
jgi:arylsulfatase